MTFPGAIDYRHCCLLFILSTTYYRVTVSITVIDNYGPAEKDRARDIKDTVDDARSEKAEDEDAENKHFMDVYSLQSGPQQLEFGHVFEDPNVWEQRYEKKDFDAQRYQGKVKWGDKDGGYGEQYWDLNHGGAGESAHEDNGQYEEMNPLEHAQESRQRSVVYKPAVVIQLVKNKSKKPTRSVRNNNINRLLEPAVTQSMGTGNADKKNAPVLVFDLKTGVVMDEATGNKFILKPINK
ncbi:uncharacterized protein LOC112689418 isoform X2 [Sipha flava]|uniref:Uncharacterized protein LOC112689418 isoform X2 n=1 Tax=Sipha flava TaxID=143950 RepID=A0A8B8G7Q8_9HEMI|nr:uncharacterized protein LOC112689418 isoform X2 [Sipha flava]